MRRIRKSLGGNPWNTGGATQARVLGVPTLTYLPYCFFNIISPFMSILIASINYRIRRFSNHDEQVPEGEVEVQDS